MANSASRLAQSFPQAFPSKPAAASTQSRVPVRTPRHSSRRLQRDRCRRRCTSTPSSRSKISGRLSSRFPGVDADDGSDFKALDEDGVHGIQWMPWGGERSAGGQRGVVNSLPPATIPSLRRTHPAVRPPLPRCLLPNALRAENTVRPCCARRRSSASHAGAVRADAARDDDPTQLRPPAARARPRSPTAIGDRLFGTHTQDRLSAVRWRPPATPSNTAVFRPLKLKFAVRGDRSSDAETRTARPCPARRASPDMARRDMAARAISQSCRKLRRPHRRDFRQAVRTRRSRAPRPSIVVPAGDEQRQE